MANIKENLAKVTNLVNVPMFNDEGRLNETFAFYANVDEENDRNFFGGAVDNFRFAFTPICDKTHTKADFEKLYHKLGIEEGIIFGTRPSAKKILVVFNIGAKAQFSTFDYEDIHEAYICSNDDEEKFLSQFHNSEESKAILQRWGEKHPRNTEPQTAQPRANRPTIGVMRG